MRCRHCGKLIESYTDYRGERAWTHDDQMVGRWCWLTLAEPESEDPVSDNGSTTGSRKASA